MLYIIAGASLSGKTTIRQHITKTYGISGLDSDTLRTVTSDLRPDLNVGHDQDVSTNYNNMRPMIQAFIKARGFFDENYLLEGDCVNLDDALDAAEQGAKVIVLGYPNSTVDEILDILDSASSTHWSKGLSRSDLGEKAKSFIEYSKFLQAEATAKNLNFIDVSSRLGDKTVVDEITDQLMSQN